MTAAVVNSILARCMLDAGFLGEVSRDPARALAGYDLDEATLAGFRALDTARVRSFAGFMNQVKHSHLWESFPFTMALLKAYRMAVEVFAEYVPEAQAERERPGSTLDDRTARFVAFLSAALGARRRWRRPGLRAVLAHERAMWELGIDLARSGGARGAPERVDTTGLRARDLGAIVPVVQGALRVDAFDHDPLVILEALAEGAFSPARVRPRRLQRAYWADAATREIRIFALEPELFELLRAVDGRRSVRAVVDRARRSLRGARRRAGPLSPSDLRPHMEALFARGLLIPAARIEERSA